MPIYFGNKLIDLNFGNTVIDYAYFGNKLVYVRDNSMPPMSMRFKFTRKNFTPTGNNTRWPEGSTWTKVPSNSNIWDFTYNSTNWNNIFADKSWPVADNEIYVLSATVSGITGAANLFKNMGALKSVYPFDTSQCVTFERLFQGCSRLKDIPEFNTFKVTNMSRTFYGSGITAIPYHWSYRSVTRMDYCFADCKDLEHDVSGNDYNEVLVTTNLNTMWNMFEGCTKMKRAPGLITQNVRDMSHALERTGITATPGNDWGWFDVTAADYLFKDCTALLDGGFLFGLKPTHVHSMFENCINMVTPPEMSFENFIFAQDMFKNCSAMTAIGDNSWIYPSGVYICSGMFYNCRSIDHNISRMYEYLRDYNKFAAATAWGSAYHYPNPYKSTFYNCGVDGAASAELEEIPEIWKAQ